MTRRLALILALAAIALSAQPQKTPPRQPQQPQPDQQQQQAGSFEGTVSSTTGQPISDARIILRGVGQGMSSQLQNTVSGLDGKFSFTQLPPGRYSLSVQHPGFIMANGRMPGLTQVKANETATTKLTLSPASSITGRVVDADGQPVEFATVQVLKISMMRGGRTTDERGEFRLYGLQPGKYMVLATPAPHDIPAEIRADGSREEQNIPTYYPNSTAMEGATRVEVAEGATVNGIEIRLARAPIAHLSGTIRGAAPKDYPNFLLQPTGRILNGMPPRQPRYKDGSFSFPRLAPGKYTLTAFFFGEGHDPKSTETIELEVGDKDIENIQLEALPSVDIEGRVKWTDEDKGKAETLAQLDISSPATMQISGSMYASFEVGGAFHLKGVQRRLYPVTVMTSRGAPAVQSVEMGGVEMPDRMLDLRHGATGPITIVISPDTGQLTGKVETTKTDVTLVLVKEHASGRGNVLQSRLGPNGEYEFKAVPIGDYKLVLIDTIDMSEIFGSGELGFYEAGAKSVKVRANDSLTIDWKQP